LRSTSEFCVNLSNFPFLSQIKYENSPFAEKIERENKINGRLKTSKVSIGYYSQENAVRISTISKIGVTDKTNPCIEGTANCGENTICVASSEDSYDVS
jgi:hypothetical protein